MLSGREATQEEAGAEPKEDAGQSMAASSQALAKEVDATIQRGYASIVRCTKKAQSFPSAHENSLLIALPQYIRAVERTSDKVMALVDSLLKRQNIPKSMAKLYREGQKDILLEANDKLLESIHARIDVMAGVRTPAGTPVTQSRAAKESWNRSGRASNVWRETHEARPTRPSWFLTRSAPVTARPQLSFADKVDNSYEGLFVPKLKEKPNALKPLAILLEKYEAVQSYCHPYEYELDLFQPGERLLACPEPRAPPPPLADTPLVMVTEPSHVAQLLADLKQETEVAVDLEYHSYRSYQGFTCLMQLSTRTRDYLVDTLALRDRLQDLNQVFTDPRVLKVFHGADCDIPWLQKDLGLYVVGMFDTHQACKFLPLPRQSLAYLLKHYCGVDSDKTFQLFDWRVRPLPPAAVAYARADTHYLLHVHDCMRRELSAHGQTNLVQAVFGNSRSVCKRRYNKPVFDPDGYRQVFRTHALLNRQQQFALQQLWRWRDATARQQDESPGYLLPNHMLLQMAQSLPRDVQGVFACCNPVPAGVRAHALALHALLLKARLQPLVKPIEKTKPSLAEKRKPQVSPPHDAMDSLNYRGLPPVFPDKLPAARDKQTVRHPPPPTTSSKDTGESTRATIGLFFEDKTKADSNKVQRIKLKAARFETPYQRFLKSKEYARAVQEKRDKEEAERRKEAPPAPVLAPPLHVKVVEKTAVVLKEIKTEEKVELEKAKRKKALQEREEGEAELPASKKIKVEEHVKPEPKENVKANPGAPTQSAGAAKKTHPVDYSKVNYNKKYMAKTPEGGADSQKGKKSKGKGGKGKRKKQR